MGWTLSNTPNPFTDGTSFAAASMDTSCNNGTVGVTAQQLLLVFVPVRRMVTVSTVYFSVATAGVTAGAGVNQIAVFNASGAIQQAISADMTTAFAAPTGNKNTGAMTAFSIVSPGVWVAFLANYTGTTVALAAGTATGVTANMIGAGPIPGTTAVNRGFFTTTGNAAMPATINPATVSSQARIVSCGLA